MVIKEVNNNAEITSRLIELSKMWYEEDSCYGYRINSENDIAGNRIFVAIDNDEIIAYLFGKEYLSEDMKSIMKENTSCFEVEEFYVIKEKRNKGIGRKLFHYLEDNLGNVEYITLSCANKNYVPTLHLYNDELDMKVHSIRLYKRIEKSDR